MTIEEKAKRYDGNYKTYIELINRFEDVKEAIKKQNYGIAMDILCKPYPEYQITTSTELKENVEERIRKAMDEILEIQRVKDILEDYRLTREALLSLCPTSKKLNTK